MVGWIDGRRRVLEEEKMVVGEEREEGFVMKRGDQLRVERRRVWSGEGEGRV